MADNSHKINLLIITPKKTFYSLDEIRSSEILKKYPHFNKPWKIEEMRQIRTLFVDEGKRIADIALCMQRTEKAIRLKLMAMGEIHGFLAREGTQWNENDIERMVRFYEQDYSLEEISRFLGRRKRDVKDHLEFEIGEPI